MIAPLIPVCQVKPPPEIEAADLAPIPDRTLAVLAALVEALETVAEPAPDWPGFY